MEDPTLLRRANKGTGYIICRMSLDDLSQVAEIERTSFPSPWSFTFFEQELRYNKLAHYFVACRQEDSEANRKILGYVGLRVLAGEAHLTTIAVKEEERGKGIGECLLIFAIEFSQQRGARSLTLEVRTSNLPAQSLYRKYGFVEAGIRRRYYIESGEDALLMDLEDLSSPSFQAHLQQLKQSLAEKAAQRPTA